MLFQEEKLKNERISTSWEKLLRKCESLHNQLQECRVKLLIDDEKDQIMGFPTSSLPGDNVEALDDQINLLLSEVFMTSVGFSSLRIICSTLCDISFYNSFSLRGLSFRI